MNNRSKVLLIVTTVSLLIFARPTSASPYASDVTNNAGLVSFRLNESADNVKIISGGGAVTNDLGPGVKGLTLTNLGIASGNIKVVVLRSAPAGYTQASDDGFQDNGVYVNKFEQPRGLVINKNPATPSFGRVYVANGRGEADTAGPFVRTTYQGIYAINADNTVALDTGTFPRTAGLGFTPGNTASPMRLGIGKEDNLLYICDFSDPSGGLWVCDLNVETNSLATNALAGIGDLGFGSTIHGSTYGVVVEGTFAGSNLKIFTLDEDLTPVRSVWRYDVNGGPFPHEGSPVGPLATFTPANFAGKVVRGGSSNYLYCSQNRSAGTDGPSIRVFNADGIEITNSLDASRQYLGDVNAADLLRNTTALDISPDGSTLALLRGSSFGSVLLVPLSNGVFNFAATNSFSLGASGASDNNRDIAYDAAGNLYAINTATEWLRIFSRGGATVATTGTDGTFTIGTPPLLVSVRATVASANEPSVNGQFTITRSGDVSGTLTVNYTVTGTATAGADYTALPGSVTLLAGTASTNIAVAVSDDGIPELTETVILTISGSANYGVATGSATVSILDDEPTELSLMLAQTESRLLEGFAGSKVGFQLTRRGLAAPGLTANVAYSGAAALGVRFNGPSTVSVGTNVANVTFNLTPINDESFQGNQTAIVSVVVGSGYAIGATNSATATIVDDEHPPGPVLFADNFETNSSIRWIVNSADGGFDSFAEFAYDYSQVFIPPAPGGSSTLGLRFRLNELTGAPRNAISASPLELVLGSSYRLKFNMWINYNGPLFDGGLGSTMHLTAGVGTTPDHANLATSAISDGIWFGVSGDGGSTLAIGDCNAYAATALFNDDSGVYAAGTGPADGGIRRTTHPFYALWGNIPAPAAQLANFPSQTGTSGPGNIGVSWHTVVVTKTTNAVTWVVDGILIATVPADSVSLSTNVFVGYQDLFPGAAAVPAMSFAIVDNLRVETFISAPISITGIAIVGGSVEITFTGPAEVPASSFKLQSAATVGGTYADDNIADVTPLGTGTFRATTDLNANHFYRIKL